jgi:exonuclease III
MSIFINKKISKAYCQEIKVISWNLDITNINIESKINEIIVKNADILMLQECTKNIKNQFIDYISYKTSKGNDGTINLLIHKRLKPFLKNIFKDNGLLLYHLDTVYGQIIVASIHLPPFNKINNKILRTTSIYKVINFLKKENLTKLPIIIGGDTNMQEDEHIDNLSEDILEDLYDNYGDEYNYHTWPTKNINNQKKQRFDRFFYSNLNVKNFFTWASLYSEHHMIETNITFGKILFDSINAKLEEIKFFNKENYKINNCVMIV